LNKNARPIIIFLCIFVLLFIPNWLIHFLALLLLLTYLLSYIYISIFYHSIRVYRKENIIRAYRQQSFEVTIIIENHSFLPIHFFFLKDFPAKLETKIMPQLLTGLAPWQKIEFSYSATGSKRGVYKISPILIKYSDPLSFFPTIKKIPDELTVIVYPRLCHIELSHNKGLPSGNILSRNRIYEDITRYSSLREYQSGDDTRRIEWKASARLGKLYTRKYLSSIYFPVMIYLNLTRDDYPKRYRYSYIERAIEIAASLTRYFIGIGQNVGLITSGVIEPEDDSQKEESLSIPFRDGYPQAINILEILAQIKASDIDFNGIILRHQVRIPFGARLCIISPALSLNQLDYLCQAEKRGWTLEWFQINPKESKDISMRKIRRYDIKDYGYEILKR
jgi:uncharacterized protein (DUF58 family)